MHLAVPPRSPRLTPFVSALGYYESTLPAGRDRVLPGGATGLMVNLHEDEFRTYDGPGAMAVRRAPGAVLTGAEDGHNETAEALADTLPRGRYTELPGDHFSAVNSPEFTAAVIDFLTAQQPAAREG